MTRVLHHSGHFCRKYPLKDLVLFKDPNISWNRHTLHL